MEVKEIAQKLRDKLKKYDDFQGLYLYGSRVKDNYQIDSDIDIVAVFEKDHDHNKELDICGSVLEVELDHDVVIDFHPMTPEALNINYIYFNEIKKGIYYGI